MSRRARNLLSCAAVCVLAFAAATPLGAADAEGPEDTILVMDASGSMWGQIDGVNKIVIAKEVMEALIRSIPEERKLGLVAYGHRRKGDCKDIETLAQVGADRDELISAVRALSPRGKTPLSASVKHAAEHLNYTKMKTTIILVSDGKETCDYDPCELGRLLEEKGLDFTVHVVGFDVTIEERKGLECLAQETGGKFLAADNAEELNAALLQVAAVREPQTSTPVPSKLVLKATILPGGPQINDKLTWTVVRKSDGAPAFTEGDAGIAETELPAGEYGVSAVWTGWDEGGEKKGSKQIVLNEQQVHVVTVPIDLGLPVSLDAPAAVMEAEPVQVTWSGPDQLGAQVVIAELDSGPMDKIFFFPSVKARADHERRAKGENLDTDGDGDFDDFDKARALLSTPPIPGRYELRYVLRRPNVILARRPIELTPREITLEVPEQVPVSTQIKISCKGPAAPGDLVTLLPKGDKRKYDNAHYSALKPDGTATLWTPAEAGEYQVRYVLASAYNSNSDYQYRVKVAADITVTAVSAGLAAPDTAIGGSTISVDWEGPEGWTDDGISIVLPGAEGFNRDARASVAGYKGERIDPVEIRVPAIPGDYEVVYVVNPGKKVIARRPIRITEAMATVSAPESVKAGEDFVVTYSGHGFGGDRVVIAPADVPDQKMWGYTSNYGFSAAPDGSQGTIAGRLTAGKPGEYEVRYVTGLQHQVLARCKLTVTE